MLKHISHILSMICNFKSVPIIRYSTLVLLLFAFLYTTSAFRFSKGYYPWAPTNGCSNFDGENACRGNQTQNDDSWARREFQTPPRGDSLWIESWQDYNILSGYPQVIYTPDKRSAKIDVKTRLNPKYSGAQLKYILNGTSQSSSTMSISAPSGVLDIKV